jgi:hypothetical protein
MTEDLVGEVLGEGRRVGSNPSSVPDGLSVPSAAVRAVSQEG